MRKGRIALATAVIFVTALLWNGLVHLVLLAEDEKALRSLQRPDLSDRAWLGLVLTAAFALLFVLGYALVARGTTLRDGLVYGVFVAALAGLLVDLNQYLLYPIPGPLAAKWFLGGLIELTLYGLIVARLLPPRAPDV